MDLYREKKLKGYIEEHNLPLSSHWLDQASTHSSFTNEHNYPYSNERLESLGDSVLDLLTLDWLYDNFSGGNEGDYTILRSSIVNNKNLGKMGEKLALQSIIQISSGTQITPKILADCVESLFGAIFKFNALEQRDSISICKDVFLKYFKAELDDIREGNIQIDSLSINEKNPKSKLLEYIAKNKLTPIQISFLGPEGPDHEKTFRVQYSLVITNENRGKSKNLVKIGQGFSKKASEMDAAKQILEDLAKRK